VNTQRSIETFLEAATSAGWRIERRNDDEPLDLPVDVSQRYRSVPQSYLAFLCKVAGAASADGRAWFLCETQFHPSDPEGFAWNEIERMALESAADETERQTITSFWDRHLPIVMVPDGDYDYLAIALPEGAVVHGCAPEWEEVDRVADSFEDWLSMLAKALLEPDSSSSKPFALRLACSRRQ